MSLIITGGEKMSNNMEEIIMQSCDLPTMPDIAGKIVQLVSDPNTTAGMLNKAIMADQSMAARVLKLANSSFYGCLRSVNTLTQAIVIIGFGTIKNIVLAASTKEVYKRFGLLEKMLHEHSTAVAMASFHVASVINLKNKEEAYLAGLLHDIGKVVLNNSDADKFRSVMEEVYNTGRNFAEVEQEVYGFSHYEVGALVIRKWNFSPEMEAVIRFQRDLDKLEKGDIFALQLASVVNLADALCFKLGVGVKEAGEIDIESLKALSILKLDSAKVANIEEKILKSAEEGEHII